MTDTTWADVRVALAVAQLVDRAADDAGLPRNVLRAFVLAESGGRPDAIGDSGASVGLLQLHERGQGAGMSVAERKDPARNLTVGVPPIARAWQQTAAMPYSRARVERVALTSGHPTENVDVLTVGSQPWHIAMDGAARIGTWWEALERTHPTDGRPAPTPATVGAAVTRATTYAGDVISWGREHPVVAIVAGVVAAAALLL